MPLYRDKLGRTTAHKLSMLKYASRVRLPARLLTMPVPTV